MTDPQEVMALQEARLATFTTLVRTEARAEAEVGTALLRLLCDQTIDRQLGDMLRERAQRSLQEALRRIEGPVVLCYVCQGSGTVPFDKDRPTQDTRCNTCGTSGYRILVKEY